MAEISKVIRGLELCAYDPDPGQELKEIRSCPECPYYRAGCSPQLIRDALALLKEQEARVLTVEEIKCLKVLDVLWLEFTGGYEGSVYSAFPVVIYMIGKRHVDFWGRGGRDWSFYNCRVNGWRLWTANPTPEQMRDTKWEEEYDG